MCKVEVREGCRRRMPLDGADAQALEHALTITERERDTALSDAAKARSELSKEHTTIKHAKSFLRGTLGFIDGVTLATMAQEVAKVYHQQAAELSTLRAQLDEAKQAARLLVHKNTQHFDTATKAVEENERLRERVGELCRLIEHENSFLGSNPGLDRCLRFVRAMLRLARDTPTPPSAKGEDCGQCGTCADCKAIADHVTGNDGSRERTPPPDTPVEQESEGATWTAEHIKTPTNADAPEEWAAQWKGHCLRVCNHRSERGFVWFIDGGNPGATVLFLAEAKKQAESAAENYTPPEPELPRCPKCGKRIKEILDE